MLERVDRLCVRSQRERERGRLQRLVLQSGPQTFKVVLTALMLWMDGTARTCHDRPFDNVQKLSWRNFSTFLNDRVIILTQSVF